MRSLLLLLPAALLAQPPRFASSTECALCHTNLSRPAAGPSALWPASMMAHAAADPYWKSRVAEEIAAHPSLKPLIEEKCASCHAPAAKASLGAEGVTCTVCHQITRQDLGRKESFSGKFVLGTNQEIFGPHQAPFTMPMLHHTGYLATPAPHMAESALCATCHTVITPVVAVDGALRGEFVEQSPYLEWLASSLPGSGASCQSCHMPPLQDAAGLARAEYIAHNPMGRPFPPTSPRKPFSQHSFAGANAVTLRALNQEASAQRSEAMLKSALSLEVRPRWLGGALEIGVETTNLTGHKLPTGFPSRRLWLHTRVLDAAGNVLFDSGAAPPPDQPHYNVIDSSSQVQVYEARAVDTAGAATASLLSASRYAKDNRILPAGFVPSRLRAAGMDPAVIASGGTEADRDFLAGSDTVLYRLGSAAAAKVVVEALYQSIPGTAPISIAFIDCAIPSRPTR